ncbi:MAG: hypothetical protein KDA77_03945, partial [Planctomycetaceae bacterium]|nr:hypothetical protein [Planctomycetaceae bacterium]
SQEHSQSNSVNGGLNLNTLIICATIFLSLIFAYFLFGKSGGEKREEKTSTNVIEIKSREKAVPQKETIPTVEKRVLPALKVDTSKLQPFPKPKLVEIEPSPSKVIQVNFKGTDFSNKAARSYQPPAESKPTPNIIFTSRTIEPSQEWSSPNTKNCPTPCYVRTGQPTTICLKVEKRRYRLHKKRMKYERKLMRKQQRLCKFIRRKCN